jgi:uncharacterized protein YjbI with pentapeptide repeats
MKCVKDMEHGVLTNCFELNGKAYLCVSVLTFFYFDRPDEPLRDYVAWPMVMDQIGESTLDQSMPKPQAEVVVHGSCHTPEKKPLGASHVSFRLGTVSKRLAVFGYRYWETQGGMKVITKPKAFTSMPIDWEHAYGGPEYPKNPLGRGRKQWKIESGGQAHPLPNIEYPHKPMGSPKDKPEPAGLRPLDPMWPQRYSKTGTYDDKWLHERWPYYPEDFDCTFFNVTPEDQWSKEYFTGAETFEVVNMHPEKRHLSSRLPAFRQRVFINQLDHWRDRKGPARFREAKVNMDTVWLFPEIELGVAIHRATIDIADDEPLDVKELFLASEPLKEKPKSIEHYFEELQRRTRTKVEFSHDMSEIENDARRRLMQLEETLKDMPKKIEDAFDAGLGKTPQKIRTPEETNAMAAKAIDQGVELFKQGEKMLAEAKPKIGHTAKIDLKPFQQARVRLLAAKQQIAKTCQDARKVEADAKKQLASLQKQVNKDLEQAKQTASFPKDLDLAAIEQMNADMDALAAGPDQNPWVKNGFNFVYECKERLKEDQESLGEFRGYGFRPYTLERGWIGINPEPATFRRSAWGLKPLDDASAPDDMVVPAGLVLPLFDGPTLKAIVVRTGEKFDHDSDVLIDGSEPLVLTRNIQPGKPVAVVREHLEARLLEQEADGLAGVAAMKHPGEKLEPEILKAMQSAPQLLVVLNKKQRFEQELILAPYKALHPNPEPLILPEEDNLPSARKKGVKLRPWLIQALREDLRPEEKEEEMEETDRPAPEFGPKLKPIKIPEIDYRGLVQRCQQKVKDAVAVEAKAMKAQKKAGLAELKKILGQDPKVLKVMEDHGQTVDSLLAGMSHPAPDPPGNPFAGKAANVAALFGNTKDALAKQGQLTPQLERKLNAQERMFAKLLDKGAKQWDQGMKQLEAVKKPGGPFSEEDKARLKSVGYDPDDPTPLTRERVVEKYRKGESLAWKNIAGLDLSGLDLRGADLTKANASKTNFSGARLDKANLTEIIAVEADFTKAGLRKANMPRAILKQAKLRKANLDKADMTCAMLIDADMTKASCRKTVLDKAFMEKTQCCKADFRRADLTTGFTLEADFTKASFRKATLDRTLFSQAKMDKADFSGATTPHLHIYQSHGAKVDFTEADVSGIMVLGESNLPQADFRNATGKKICFHQSELPDADFRGGKFEAGMIEQCDLARANFQGVPAKEMRFRNSDLENSNFKQANLMHASMSRARLTNASLEGSNLYGAEFYKTKMGNTNLDNANIKMTYLAKFKEHLKDFTKK